MKRIYKVFSVFSIFSVFSVSAALSQTAYDAEKFATTDLNGTARYVGMGGAMGALGGDMTTMTTNPAGTAMMSRGDISFTMSGLFGGTKGVLGRDRGRASIDQAGVVIPFAIDEGSLRNITLGINFNKNKNFFGNQDTEIANLGQVFSQTWQLADMANGCTGLADDQWGILPYAATEEPSILGYDQIQGHYGYGAEAAHYQRNSYGGQSEVDLNMGFNISNQIFLGFTLGIHDMDYHRNSMYEELGVDDNFFDFTSYYRTYGDGVDVKLGAIFRPIASSPFRFGVSIHTPTWYRLTDYNGTELYYNDQYVYREDAADFKYRYRTPWKFGLSVGHTIGDYFAIGAEYELADLSSCKYNTETDFEMNNDSYFAEQNWFIKNNLQTQHTFKVGMEVKPADNFSIRCGYNYVSAPTKADAYHTLSPTSMLTDTDYTNWKTTNRLTLGLGFKFKGGYFDLAYQYSTQKGDFYAFNDSYTENGMTYSLAPTEIENNRSQVMATLGFRF